MKLGKYSKAVKRLGSRYGKRTRERLAKVETSSKADHKCPYCNYVAAKRVANGIFYCKKCNSKFTGKAYMPMKQKTVKHVKQEKVSFEDELFTEKKKKNEEQPEKLGENEEVTDSGNNADIEEVETGPEENR